MSETSKCNEHEWHWYENEWLLLIDVVIRGLWVFACLGVFCLILKGTGGGEGGVFIAFIAVGLMTTLAKKVWQLIQRVAWRAK